MKNKEILSNGIKYSGIALPIIILAPVLITMGFKGLKIDNGMVGWVFLCLGIVAALTGMLLLSKGIKYLLDYLFEK